MASPQQVRMLVTKAQRWDGPTQQEATPSLQRSYTCSTTGMPNHDQHLLPSASAASMFTPLPPYQEPPISLRPLYAGKDSKPSMLAHEQYPFQSTETKDDQRSHLSRQKMPFWRTKKGIALIVLLSNAIVLAIVLGIVFGSRQENHHSHHRFTTNDNNASGENSAGSLPPADQSNSLPSLSQATVSTSPSSPSSTSPTSSSTPGSVSMLPVFTPVPSQPNGPSQAGVNGNGTNSVGGQSPGATGTNGPLSGPRATPSTSTNQTNA